MLQRNQDRKFKVRKLNFNRTSHSYMKIAKIIISYLVDALLPLSVIVLTKCVVHGFITHSGDNIYFEWCTDCYFFFISFVFVQTYLRTFIIGEQIPYGFISIII
jgi:hypothetical protein